MNNTGQNRLYISQTCHPLIILGPATVASCTKFLRHLSVAFDSAKKSAMETALCIESSHWSRVCHQCCPCRKRKMEVEVTLSRRLCPSHHYAYRARWDWPAHLMTAAEGLHGRLLQSEVKDSEYTRQYSQLSRHTRSIQSLIKSKNVLQKAP